MGANPLGRSGKIKVMDLSIIIVNWNTRQLLDNCLSSIYKNWFPHQARDDSGIMEIFVVDNASSDGSAEMVTQKYLPANDLGQGRLSAGLKIHLIKNQKNVGFAAANNQAIKQARGKYILVLNSDTVILENALEKAAQIMEQNTGIGILGPKTLNSDMTQQKTVRADPAFITQLFVPTKMKKLFPQWKALKKYYCDDFDYEKSAFVRQLQGSFLLIRREIFDKIGLFDEKFFIWFEEVDFCLRVRKAGYKILYSPAIKIIQHGGKSFSKLNTIKKQGLYSQSLLHYFHKNKPKWQWLALRLFKLPILLLNKFFK